MSNPDRRRLSRQGERAARAYELLLRLYPRAHRQAFGEQMLQAFRDHYQDQVEASGERASRFWLGVMADEGRSLLREQVIAFRERIWTVKKALVSILAATMLVMAMLLVTLPGRSPGQHIRLAMNDPIWRPILELAMLLLTLGLYTALVAAFVLLARSVLRAGNRPLGWVRLGLALGGIFSLYAVISNVLGMLLPTSDLGGGEGFLVLTLPLLLTGVVGMIGGYTTGAIRTGAFAGLLAGFLNLLANHVSGVLVIVLAWPAIQHNLLPSGVEADLQRFVQAPGRVPDLGTFLNFELFEDGIGFLLVVSLIGLTLEGLCATLGGWIGAALRRADERGHHPAPSPIRPVLRLTRPGPPIRLLLLALVLCPLVWIGTVELNALGGAHRLFGLSDLASSFVNQTFGLWLLGMLVMLAFVLVSAWPQPPAAWSILESGQ